MAPVSRFLFLRASPLGLLLHRLQSCTSVVVDNQHVITRSISRPCPPAFCRRFPAGGLWHRLHSLYRGPPPSTALSPALLTLAACSTAPRRVHRLAVDLWMSALNALYRDVRYVVPFLVQFWMFASPSPIPARLSRSAGAGSTASTPWPRH